MSSATDSSTTTDTDEADGDEMNTDTEPWVEKHRPEYFSHIQGNNSDIKKIKSWAKNWSPGDIPILMHGEPGVGKTTCAKVTASTYDWPIVEINASSSRRKEDIKQIVKQARKRPDGNLQLILLDEIDSLHSRSNLTPLTDLLKEAPNPIMLTANDIYSVPDSIKNNCREMKFTLGVRSRKAKIKKIAKEENMDLGTATIGRLAKRPDLRSAINDLQKYAQSDGETKLGYDSRQWDVSEWDVIDAMLNGETIRHNITPEDLIFWLDQNWRENASDIGRGERNLRGIEIPVSFDALSRSDIFLQRARQDDYRFWRYAGALQDCLPGLRLTEPFNPDYIPKDFPDWFRKKEQSATASSPEAKLYRSLSEMESGEYVFSGSFSEFYHVILPIIKDLPREDRFLIAFENDIEDETELEAMDIVADEYEQFRRGEVTEAVQKASLMDF